MGTNSARSSLRKRQPASNRTAAGGSGIRITAAHRPAPGEETVMSRGEASTRGAPGPASSRFTAPALRA